MLDYRNILRVASDPHKSMRTMELELRSSHHTIRKVLDAAEKAGISWPLPENVTNEMLIELLFPEEYQKTVLYAVPDYAYIHGELAKRVLISPFFGRNTVPSARQKVLCLTCTPIFVKSMAVGPM